MTVSEVRKAGGRRPVRRRVSDSGDGADQGADRGDEGSRDRSSSKSRRTPRPSSEITAAEAAQAARRQISELTAKDTEAITSVNPSEEGWSIEVEVVDGRRIPATADVLALYKVELDAAGKLLSYHRTQRYTRGHGG
jgi:hypothetical protein